jgi:hypothetical protein
MGGGFFVLSDLLSVVYFKQNNSFEAIEIKIEQLM